MELPSSNLTYIAMTNPLIFWPFPIAKFSYQKVDSSMGIILPGWIIETCSDSPANTSICTVYIYYMCRSIFVGTPHTHKNTYSSIV